MSKLIAFLSMIATLAVAYGLDWRLYLLQRRASADFNFAPFIWISVAANLLIAGLWIFLAWWVLFRTSRSWWVGGVYLVLGILLTVLLPVQLTAPEQLRNLTFFTQTQYIRATFMMVGFTSRFFLSAAYIAVLGAASLLPRRIGEQAIR